jgi:NAD(P)-dependent dehydrogenase (short-subunit alcohol dehydrogenase family)
MRRVCILTGAAGLLGQAFCDRFGQDYDILAQYHHAPPKSTRPARARSAQAARFLPVQADLAVAQDIERLVDRALETWRTIDLVVNCAVHSQWGHLLHDGRALASAERQMLVNVVAPLKLSALAAHRAWRCDRRTNIDRNRNVINVSSTAGLFIHPGQGQGVYSASKAALNYLTYHLASDFEPIGVRANAIAPTSFPSIVPVDAVLDGIRELDAGQSNSAILVVDEAGSRYL